MPKPIRDQVIVITGASSGIGRATAREAGRRGARVVLAARTAERLERAADEIRRCGGEAVAVPTDVADYACVEALARRAVAAYGRIDTWINGAAVLDIAAFRAQPLPDFERVVRIDFMGQVHGAKAALPHLEATDGALLCIGSAYGIHGAPLWSAYSAAKHALKGWLDALRVELAHDGSGIRVTLITPSAIRTPILERAARRRGVRPRLIPPVYEPEAAAGAILRAAESDRRDVYVGVPAALLAIGERVSPRVVDRFMRVAGYRLEAPMRRKRPKPPSRPAAPGRAGRPRDSARAKSSAGGGPASAHPLVSSVVAAAGLGLVGLLLLRL